MVVFDTMKNKRIVTLTRSQAKKIQEEIRELASDGKITLSEIYDLNHMAIKIFNKQPTHFKEKAINQLKTEG